jgi:hypothetical protein
LSLEEERWLGLTSFAFNFASGCARRVGGHLSIDGVGVCYANREESSPLKQASGSVSDRFSRKWSRNQIGPESDSFGIR